MIDLTSESATDSGIESLRSVKFPPLLPIQSSTDHLENRRRIHRFVFPNSKSIPKNHAWFSSDRPLRRRNHQNPWQLHKRLCDFCNKSTTIMYCRADTTKLCLSCDREVHSTNQLFIKHTRALLCDGCDSSLTSIFFSTDVAVHCQNRDWEAHSKTNSNSNSPTRTTDDHSKGSPDVHRFLICCR
ncbi:hypothetical protein L6452_09470 [Arctium lappa]|uniref:Uncharacterized protein n=1 Tax=Arctium lappa TaxID=4217 RepID=A0ACB9DKN1_ARCLA|nr:hypothetical protein L6452_09470 [Arctium lappa]